MSSGPDAPPRRFVVTWRDAGTPTPRLHSIGCLEFDGHYRFCYLPGAHAQGFQPLPGFPDLAKPYEAEVLFPFFASRVMPRQRPEFPELLEALDLPPDAADIDILARSGGATRGDRLFMVEEPQVAADGETAAVFLVRGVRFALPDEQVRDSVLGQLARGTRLDVRPEPHNEVDSDALLVCASGGQVLGWVPEALTGYVRLVMSDASGSLLVRRCSGPEQPPHVRLLVAISGRLVPGRSPLADLQDDAVALA